MKKKELRKDSLVTLVFGGWIEACTPRKLTKSPDRKWRQSSCRELGGASAQMTRQQCLSCMKCGKRSLVLIIRWLLVVVAGRWIQNNSESNKLLSLHCWLLIEIKFKPSVSDFKFSVFSTVIFSSYFIPTAHIHRGYSV